jgi:hypothetical protein
MKEMEVKLVLKEWGGVVHTDMKEQCSDVNKGMEVGSRDMY